MSSKAYSFFFNASDWLASGSVKLMSKAERGAYIDLLAIAWRQPNPGTLPASEDKVRRLSELSREEWTESGETLLDMFPLSECGTFRYNPRLLQEVERQREISEKNAENGRKSAERRATEKAAKEAAAAEAQRKLNEKATTVEIKATTVGFEANESSTKISKDKQSTNVDEEREQDSSSSALDAIVETQTQVAAAAPVDAAKAQALATTDPGDEQRWQDGPLTKPLPFKIICDRVPLYRGIAYEHYRALALATLEGTETSRTIKQWESWIWKFLANQTPKGGKLLTGAEQEEQGRTGVHAPQSPNAPNFKIRPEVQAKRDADFELVKQQRIAANLARNAADGLSQQTQPGGIARSF